MGKRDDLSVEGGRKQREEVKGRERVGREEGERAGQDPGRSYIMVHAHADA